MKATTLAAAFVALLPLAAHAQAPAGWAGFTRTFDAYADSGRIVGASVLFVRDGRVVARHDHGLADRARAQRVDTRTLFHYGSITKTLTAIAIMQLVERGKLSLDTHITRFVPELRQVHDPYGMIDSITVRMLLSHSAGFQNPTWPYTEGKPWEPFEPTTWNQLVAMMPYQELHFRPGSRWSYSNPGYIYLARAIEALTGDPWETYVQKNILTPLGLTRSYFGVTPYWLAADRSDNYTIVKDSAGRVVERDNGREFDPGITIPNGGWNAPLSDLARYAAFLMGSPPDGDTAVARRYDFVLPRAWLERMWQPVIALPPQSADSDIPAAAQYMGLGFFLLRYPDETIVGHTGSQAGFLAFLWVNPARRRAIIAAFNTDNQVGGSQAAFAPIQRAALTLVR